MHARATVVLLGVLGGVLTACPGPQNPCDPEDPASCPAGTTCSEETGACVLHCDEACEAFEYCNQGTRACEARFAAVEITRPTDGGRIGRTVNVDAVLVPVDGAPAGEEPASLALTVEPVAGGNAATGALTRVDAGFYQGSTEVDAEGFYTVEASYVEAEITSQQVTVETDFTPPTLFLTWTNPTRSEGDATHADERDPETGFQNAFRRDEVMQLKIEASEAVDPADLAVTIIGVATGGGTGEVSGPFPAEADTGCPTGHCYVAEIDLAQPEFYVFRGELRAVVEGPDDVGNLGAADAGIPVTRWKWRYSTPTNTSTPFSPAIGPDGTIYVSTATTIPGDGGVAAISHAGELLWATATGGATTNPVVGTTIDGGVGVYAATRIGTSTRLFRLEANGLATTVGLGSGIASATYLAAPALSSIAVDEEPNLDNVFAIANHASSPIVETVRPDSETFSRDALPGATENLSTGSTIVAVGNRFYFGDSAFNFRSFQVSPSDGQLTQDPSTDIGLEIAAGGIHDTSLVAFGRVGATRVITSIDLTDGSTKWTSPNLPTAAGGVVLTSSGTAFAGIAEAVVRVEPAGSSATVTSGTTASPVTLSPMLLEDATILTSSETGVVTLWTNELAPIWEVEEFGDVDAELNIDCSRNSSGAVLSGRPATVYVLSNTGSLQALLVDAKGLDTGAAWPRFQHDPRNTGNPDTPFAPFDCR